MKRRKATALPVGTRREIKTAWNKWLTKHPKGTVAEFARTQYSSVNYSQVFNVCRSRVKTDYKPRADKGVPKAPTKEAAKPLGAKRETTELFDAVIRKGLMRIEDEQMPAGDLAFAVQKLAAADKHNSDRKLSAQLKRIDAGVVIVLIRMFRPEATEEDCVLLYKTAFAKYQEERKDA